MGVARNGNSGGSTEQTATRSLKVRPERGKRFDLVVITRNESRFRSSTVERLIRTQQTGDHPLPEAPRGKVRYTFKRPRKRTKKCDSREETGILLG